MALIFLLGLAQRSPVQDQEELHLTLAAVSGVPETDAPRFVEPSFPVVEPPRIDIDTNDSKSGIVFAPAAMVLAPRPDPAHPNPVPAEAAESGAQRVLMVLKILVLPDGSVGDAQVVQSSGAADRDSRAIAFVKAGWRFLPAMLQKHGRAILDRGSRSRFEGRVRVKAGTAVPVQTLPTAQLACRRR